MKQEDAIRHYLESGHSIDPLTALNKFGCFRLGARIYDLSRKGLKIKSRRKQTKGRKFYHVYSL
jgi:hypothetical protein